MAWTNVITRATGYVVTATNWNEFANNFKAIGDAWTSYTPTWTGSTSNPTIGNGTITGGYLSIGKLVMGRFVITLGSTSTVGSGNYRVSTPVTAVGSGYACGAAWLEDAAPGTHYGMSLQLFDTTHFRLGQGGAAGGLLTNSSPITPATGDVISGQFCYEAA